VHLREGEPSSLAGHTRGGWSRKAALPNMCIEQRITDIRLRLLKPFILATEWMQIGSTSNLSLWASI
jgi:hypothetical protein